MASSATVPTANVRCRAELPRMRPDSELPAVLAHDPAPARAAPPAPPARLEPFAALEVNLPDPPRPDTAS